MNEHEDCFICGVAYLKAPEAHCYGRTEPCRPMSKEPMTQDIVERLRALRDEDREFYATYPMSVTAVCTDALAEIERLTARTVELIKANADVADINVGYAMEIERLNARIAELTKPVVGSCGYRCEACARRDDRIESLKAEVERLRVDTERWDYAIRFPWVFCDAYKKAPASDISITQAIDAALAKDP